MSEIRANTVSDAAGTGPVTLTGQSAAKAWASISSAPAINASLNTSSVTDNGTGQFQPNWTTAFASTSYAPISMASGTSLTPYFNSWYGKTTSSVSTATAEHANVLVDQALEIAAHGDLA